MLVTWSLCNPFLDFPTLVQSEGTGSTRPLLTTAFHLKLQHWLFSPFWIREGLGLVRCSDLCLLLNVWIVPKVFFSQVSRDSWANASAATGSGPLHSPGLWHLPFSPGGWLSLLKQQKTVHSLSLLVWFLWFFFQVRNFPPCLANRTNSVRGQAKASEKSPDLDPK